MLFLGCGQRQILTQTKTIKQKVPAELLSLEELKKPVVENDIDIINAYSTLFLHYKQCEIKIQKIKALQEGEK